MRFDGSGIAEGRCSPRLVGTANSTAVKAGGVLEVLSSGSATSAAIRSGVRLPLFVIERASPRACAAMQPAPLLAGKRLDPGRHIRVPLHDEADENWGTFLYSTAFGDEPCSFSCTLCEHAPRCPE
jgi:autotransporter passenger strand-loop-strand repeat protein